MKKNILITGSEGFIGSHLIEKIVHTKKFNVKALVLYNFNNDIGWLKTLDKKVLNQIEIVHGDIRDYDLMLKVSKKDDNNKLSIKKYKNKHKKNNKYYRTSFY